jgi:protein O-mannosyl-transferase
MSTTRKKILICIFILVSTFSVYSQVQDHEFINYDDNKYVTESSIVKAGFTTENIILVFTDAHFGMWIPITTLSYILDYELYVLNAKGYLLTNLFFHIANSLLLFLVLFRFTGAIWQSAFVAAMFAFHPLNVDSVAWVSERKNVLSTLFLLLTMWAYINYVNKPTIKKYGLVFLFFSLGLMSKPILVTLPFVLLLLDYWPLGRVKTGDGRSNNEILEESTAKGSGILQLVLEKIPLFLLIIGSSIVTVVSHNIAFGVSSLEVISLQSRLANAMVSYLEYLEKMVWPIGLSILYPHPGNALPVWQGIFSGIALLGITIISIRLIRKAPYFVVGWFWFLGTLLPVAGILRAGVHVMADHYAYISLIGVFIIIAWGIPELISKWRYKVKVLSVLAAIIIPILLLTTWEQVSHWKNSITIFKHAIRVTDIKYPNFSLVHNNLGIALFAEKKNAEAIFHYKMAINLQPNKTKAHYNLGIALFAEKKNEEAIFHYKIAIQLNPNFTNAHYNLGIIYLQKGEMREAVHHFQETVRLSPDLNAARDYLEFSLRRSQALE